VCFEKISLAGKNLVLSMAWEDGVAGLQTDPSFARSGYADPPIDATTRNLSGLARQYVFRAG
jgi:hypothetical protein